MEKLYTTKELSGWFRVTRQSIALWRKEGKLDYIRVGAAVRYSESQVQDFLMKSGAAYQEKGQGAQV